METCKICGKECKNLGVHIRTAHNMTREEYDSPTEVTVAVEEVTSEATEAVVEAMNEFPEEVPEVIEKTPGTITPDEIKTKIFGEKKRIYLDEFCTKYNISEEDLVSLVKQYKGLGIVSPSQATKQKQELGEDGAKKADATYEGGDLLITNINIAEVLMKKYGYNCIEVRSNPVKTWVLKK